MSTLRYRYQTTEFGEIDVHIRGLRDLQEFSDEDGVAAACGISSAQWSLFGVLWESGQVLADLMARYEVDGLRILEVGCGLGLASLVLNARGADVTASDVHPEAETFLAANCRLNGGPDIPFFRSAWTDECAALGTFDLIIGSDVLYEAGHPAELAGFVGRHARAASEVIVIDGGRNHHGRFRRALEPHGFAEDEIAFDPTARPGGTFRGRIMRYRRDRGSVRAR